MNYKSLKVRKLAVENFATQNTLILTFQTFHWQKYSGLKLFIIIKFNTSVKHIREMAKVWKLVLVA